MAATKTVTKRQIYVEEKPSMVSTFLGSLFSNIRREAVDSVDTILVTAGDRVVEVQKKMFKELFITTCVWASVAFLVIAAGFFLVDVAQIPRYLVFLIVGAALLIIASLRANLKD
jgi:hypothetical protein